MAFVAIVDANSQRGEQGFRLITAASGQGDVMRQQFGAADDAGCSKSRKAHGLGTVELGILERGQTD